MKNPQFVVAAVLEVIGLLAIAVGLWLVAPWAGLIGGGLGLILLGLAVDPPMRPGTTGRWASE